VSITTVALPLSAGSILMSGSFLSSWIAVRWLLVRFEGGGLVFLRAMASYRRTSALLSTEISSIKGSSVEIYSWTGIDFGVGAKFKPNCRTEVWFSVRTFYETLTTVWELLVGGGLLFFSLSWLNLVLRLCLVISVSWAYILSQKRVSWEKITGLTMFDTLRSLVLISWRNCEIYS